mgnify:CR=1 FL=1
MVDINEKKGIKIFNINSIIMYIILFFPISSTLKVYLEPLNILFTICCFVMFILFYSLYGITKKETIFYGYALIGIIINCFICRLDFFNVNMVVYFPFFLMYIFYFVRNENEILNFIKDNKKYINFIIYFWSIMIFISLFFPSSYIYEGQTKGFVSFVGTTFLLCPIAIYMFVLITIQFYLYKEKIYLLLLGMPSLCILLGTTRTYLIGLFCAWLVFIYINIKTKKLFVIIFLICVFLFIGIVFLSPIKDKFIEALNRTNELGIDPLAAFTSGRSLFWSYDMEQILSNNWWNLLFGNGSNYLYDINKIEFHNPLWAHNDFIQILADYGIVGLIVYVYLIYYLIRKILKDINIKYTIIIILVFMWFFIAFFNMFYTYFCTMLAFPFYVLIIKYDQIERNMIK